MSFTLYARARVCVYIYIYILAYIYLPIDNFIFFNKKKYIKKVINVYIETSMPSNDEFYDV